MPQFGLQFLETSLTLAPLEPFQNHLPDVAAALFGDLTRWGREQRVAGQSFHLLLARIAFAVLEPADHPGVDGLAHHQRCAVLARSNNPLHLLFRPIDTVPAPGFFKDLAGTFRCEEVPESRGDQPRFRREKLNVIGLVETRRKEAGQALLGVSHRAGEQDAKRIHVAGWRSDFDP